MLPKLLIFTTSFSLKVEYDFVIIVLRSFLFTGFPWVLLGLAFIDTPISQTLSIFGPYWLTFIIVFFPLYASVKLIFKLYLRSDPRLAL